jgi:hypothetical protein
MYFFLLPSLFFLFCLRAVRRYFSFFLTFDVFAIPFLFRLLLSVFSLLFFFLFTLWYSMLILLFSYSFFSFSFFFLFTHSLISPLMRTTICYAVPRHIVKRYALICCLCLKNFHFSLHDHLSTSECHMQEHNEKNNVWRNWYFFIKLEIQAMLRIRTDFSEGSIVSCFITYLSTQMFTASNDAKTIQLSWKLIK